MEYKIVSGLVEICQEKLNRLEEEYFLTILHMTTANSDLNDRVIILLTLTPRTGK